VLVGFFEAVCWALVVVANKRVLAYVNPLPLNFLVRLLSIAGQLAMTIPLTVFGWWELGFGLTPAAAGYIAVSSLITWLVAFNAYYYALRAGRASVVAPITSTDPIWAALFAAIILGASLGPVTMIGLLVANTGVVLIARWMGDEPGDVLDAATAPVSAAPTSAGAATGDGRARALRVVLLAVVTAAGWGLAPVVIELAENANDGPSAGMMVGSQVLGALLLGAIMLARRSRILVRPLAPDELRRVVWLLVVAGVLEAIFSVLFYLIIDAIGSVLTVLIISTSPVFSILGGVLLLKERFGARLAFATAITIGGVVLATVARMS
jgi:drug/metabolite transporter (DMT)-like permease